MDTQNVEETYKKLSALQHILIRPDTYVGSTTGCEDQMWVVEDERMLSKRIIYVPALYKIFDEVVVNAADNYQRDHKMTKLDVSISGRGVITVINDGKTIPIQIHKQHKVYVAELIFGHLLTSSNFEDQDKKVTGGRNGYGAKLANIFSTYFKVETAQATSKRILTIQWSNNMQKMKPPVIGNYQGKDYTKIQFIPDFRRFGLEKGFTNEILGLFQRRVYDLAGILKVKVFFNHKEVEIRTFQDYVRLYINENVNTMWDADEDSPRWKVILAPSDGQFTQVSFVNGVCTTKGGTHVNYIMDQIVEQVTPLLKKKAKDIVIKPFNIKCQLKVFINCLIENPTFDSQTKQRLTTNPSNFGSKYNVSTKLIKQIAKSGIFDKILGVLRQKENIKIDRQLKKIKNTKLVIPKLEDANKAGRNSNCVLILTEGDSAKSLAMSGIEYLGRDLFGVFPLRGKLINVKQMTSKQVMENVQLSNIVKIIGLQFGKVYEDCRQLRYSSVMIMADQDNDGSHIKGLVINFFETFWPSLCKIPGFLRQFVTPIIRCRKGMERIDFFSETDFITWKQQVQLSEWKVKYYKGLGTSTRAQAQQYFSDLKKHQIVFNYADQKDVEMLNLIFSKKNADLRKKWLQDYNSEINVDYNLKILKIQDFVNKQFIHFSNSDNIRSIPSIVDGLKPSQRKILFGCFKRNLKNQIKVAQLAGYVAQHSAYHHGQQSMCSTIVSMAQNYVGSNNLNLLMPIGQFGTRHLAGKDAASPRYIFTSLNQLTRLLFPEADDHIVEYQQEDNMYIEPKYYYPILPLVLINGCEGIGTGWSTIVHPHLVSDVIDLIKSRLKKQYKVIKVGWQGFTGQVEMEKLGTYLVRGKYSINGDTVTITQLPINKSISDYKYFLEEKLRTLDNIDPQLEDLREYHVGDKVQFIINFVEGKQPVDQQMEKFLKLKTTLQTTNMTLFDSKGKIRRYETISDIVEDFYQIRIKAYTKRKQYLISRFQRQLQLLDSKITFIDKVVQGQFKMMDSKNTWIQQLILQKYPRFHQLTYVKSTKKSEYQQQQDSNKDYNYLLTMPIWSFSKQKIKQLKSTKEEVMMLLNYYKKISEQELWEKDIKQFQNAWKQYKINQEQKNHKNNKHKVSYQKIYGKRVRKTLVIDSEQEDQSIQILNQDNQNQKKKKKRKVVKKVNIQDNTNIKWVDQIEKSKRLKQIKSMTIPVCIDQKDLQNINDNNQVIDNLDEIHQYDNLISKYLKPSGLNDNMSLQQRLKARLNKMDTVFVSSYKQTKELSGNKDQNKQDKQEKIDKKDDKINDLEDYDWLD